MCSSRSDIFFRATTQNCYVILFARAQENHFSCKITTKREKKTQQFSSRKKPPPNVRGKVRSINQTNLGVSALHKLSRRFCQQQPGQGETLVQIREFHSLGKTTARILPPYLCFEMQETRIQVVASAQEPAGLFRICSPFGDGRSNQHALEKGFLVLTKVSFLFQECFFAPGIRGNFSAKS